ncbi:MAG TPA: glycosyltransferase [Bacteroidia bacterium]|nr:glycosyltransferase [Bacteroidia bacterium]
MPPSPTRVLVAPLDWGLGHATRSVPVIHHLTQAGFEVILVADGRPHDFLSRRFPDLKIIRCPGYDITYPKSDQFMVHMARSGPRIAKALREERKSAQRIAEETGAEIIISDNRLNFRSDKTKNIFITHQLRVKAGMLTLAASALHRKFYAKFDEIWIPDNAGKDNLSGDLAFLKRPKKNYRYVGPLTRFSLLPPSKVKTTEQVLFMLSGPEPQRTIFEDMILKELKSHPVPSLILRGQPGQPHHSEPLPGVTMINHLDDQKLADAIASSSIVVSRGGYSTLCDLAMAGKKLICVPTPGQTEQEYLAEFHMKRGQMVSVKQTKFSLEKALEATKKMDFFAGRIDGGVEKAIETL